MLTRVALVFGASGQDGQYLSELLRRDSIKVVSISRSCGDHCGSVSDAEFVESLVRLYRPDYIFHLAANSTTRHDALFENHDAISTGALNILESVRTQCPGARVFLSGSGLQFRNEGLPIDEQSPFEASSAYSVARIQSAYAGRYFRSSFGMHVYTGFLFNHDSPLRTERHVNMAIASAVARIAAGSVETLELGDPDVTKEFNFAGDIVRGIWTLVNQDEVHEVVIGSGRAYTIREWAEYCFSRINRRMEDHVVVKPGFVPDYRTLVSNPRLIQSLGWASRVGFHDLADMMLERA